MSSPSVYQLSASNGSDSLLTAAKGTYILNSTAAYLSNVRAIVVLEDTVFDHIKTGGNDVKSTYIATPATAVKAGAILTPFNQALFTSVKLTSGSVALVL